MHEYIKLSQLKVVDQTLTTMGLAGHDLSETDIAFIWKVGRGEAERLEIADWTNKMASRLDGARPLSMPFLLDVQSAVAHVEMQIKWLNGALANEAERLPGTVAATQKT